MVCKGFAVAGGCKGFAVAGGCFAVAGGSDTVIMLGVPLGFGDVAAAAGFFRADCSWWLGRSR